MSLDPHTLALVGGFLYGPEWRRPLAKALGPLHPRGGRDTIDPRLTARWGSGARAIPDWVRPALIHMLTEHSAEALALAARLRGE